MFKTEFMGKRWHGQSSEDGGEMSHGRMAEKVFSQKVKTDCFFAHFIYGDSGLRGAHPGLVCVLSGLGGAF